MDAGELVIKASLDTKDFTIQIKETEQELATLEKRFEETKNMKPYKGQEEDLKQLAIEIEKTKNKLVGLYKQQNKVNEQGFNGMSKSLKSISKGLTNVVKTIGKWALAMFAVRSIYTGIRQIISQVSQYNEQVATDLDYMKYSIAMSLTPVVEYLVKLFYSILINVRNIIESLTGFNIFANSGAKGFKEANKQAKALQKTLNKAGFDEFASLSDNKGSGEKNYDPSVDLSKQSDLVVNGVGNTIDKIKEMITNAYASIKENVEKALFDIGFSDRVIKSVKRMIGSVELVIKGFLDVLGGVLDMAIGLLTGNGELVKKGFIRFIEGIGEILWGMITTQFNLYRTLFNTILDLIIVNVKSLVSNIGNSLSSIKSLFSSLGNFIPNVFSTAWNKILNTLNKGKTLFNTFINGLKSIVKGAINSMIEGINTLIKGINKIKFDAPNWVPVIGGKKWGFDIPKIPKLARGGIVNNPGAGVMMGNYIAGESGREAVLPLTDPSALREIGMAIGRYITVNNIVENYIDSRRINRVLQQSRNSDMMANNGGVN